MRTLLIIAALGEATTGLLLLLYPSLAIRLLLGITFAGAGWERFTDRIADSACSSTYFLNREVGWFALRQPATRCF